jgi:FMN phosphatase YigB (HAD superfamily)
MLIIGDSLRTEVQGGMNSGIDSCWFNPNNATIPNEYQPTMVINKLKELTRKL